MITKRKLDNIRIDDKVDRIIIHLNTLGYECLLVGGCVRDALLGLEPKDIDIEVYGTNFETLSNILSEHGRVDLVGQAFGVIKFSSPELMRDYDFSIPRKENKVGVKHQDFEMQFDEKMTPKEAAERRDFTFNALAYNPLTEELHDYFMGVADIESKCIRHTSEKFMEDPLRILRAMQFQARFGFFIDNKTWHYMSVMVDKGEFATLPKERIFEEWKKWAEKGVQHSGIFSFMAFSHLIKHYPEFKKLEHCPQDAIYHPEGDVRIHTELCLRHMDKIIQRDLIDGDEKIILVMATLLHDIAKPQTTEEKMKNGRMTITSEGHENQGGDMCRELLPKWGFHESLVEPIANLVSNHLSGVHLSHIDKPSSQHKFVKKLSKRLYPATIGQLLLLMEADTNGRGGDGNDIPTGAKLMESIAAELDVMEEPYESILMGRHLIEAGLKPSPLFGEILDAATEAQEEGEFSDLEGAKEWLSNNLSKFENVK